MNSDGTDLLRLTTEFGRAADPDWLQISSTFLTSVIDLEMLRSRLSVKMGRRSISSPQLLLRKARQPGRQMTV